MTRQYPSWINDYIGIPFNPDGWTKHDGFHCWSLVWDMLQHDDLNIQLPTYRERFTNALDTAHIEPIMYEGLERQWRQVETPAFGDLIFFRIGRYLCHVGFILDTRYMIHVMAGINTSMDRFTTPIWTPRCYGVFRHDSR